LWLGLLFLLLLGLLLLLLEEEGVDAEREGVQAREAETAVRATEECWVDTGGSEEGCGREESHRPVV